MEKLAIAFVQPRFFRPSARAALIAYASRRVAHSPVSVNDTSEPGNGVNSLGLFQEANRPLRVLIHVPRPPRRRPGLPREGTSAPPSRSSIGIPLPDRKGAG